MILIIIIIIIMLKRRLTKQKKIIFEILENRKDHMTAEEIYIQARKKIGNFGMATVYRNLELMRESHLIDEVYIAGWPKWYEVKKYTYHGHLFCQECGELTDVVDCSLCLTRSKLAQEKNFHGVEFWYVIVGCCSSCKKKNK